MKYYVTRASLSRPGVVTVHLGSTCSAIKHAAAEMVEVDSGELRKWKRCQFCFG